MCALRYYDFISLSPSSAQGKEGTDEATSALEMVPTKTKSKHNLIKITPSDSLRFSGGASPSPTDINGIVHLCAGRTRGCAPTKKKWGSITGGYGIRPYGKRVAFSEGGRVTRPYDVKISFHLKPVGHHAG